VSCREGESRESKRHLAEQSGSRSKKAHKERKKGLESEDRNDQGLCPKDEKSRREPEILEGVRSRSS